MWVVCVYYTPDYKKHADRLVESIQRFNIPSDVCLVSDLGDWYRNTQFKPLFLKKMLEKHKPKSIVYVDADAEFLKFPTYFDDLESLVHTNIALHVLDHSKYRRKNHPPEMLSGTIFLKNTKESRIIIDEWRSICNQNPRMWDQVALSRVLQKYSYSLLPEAYCTIFDYMASVKNPVIKHYQASREARRKTRSVVPTNPKLSQKKEVKEGRVRIKRKSIV